MCCTCAVHATRILCTRCAYARCANGGGVTLQGALLRCLPSPTSLSRGSGPRYFAAARSTAGAAARSKHAHSPNSPSRHRRNQLPTARGALIPLVHGGPKAAHPLGPGAELWPRLGPAVLPWSPSRGPAQDAQEPGRPRTAQDAQHCVHVLPLGAGSPAACAAWPSSCSSASARPCSRSAADNLGRMPLTSD